MFWRPVVRWNLGLHLLFMRSEAPRICSVGRTACNVLFGRTALQQPTAILGLSHTVSGDVYCPCQPLHKEGLLQDRLLSAKKKKDKAEETAASFEAPIPHVRLHLRYSVWSLFLHFLSLACTGQNVRNDMAEKNVSACADVPPAYTSSVM